MMESFKKAGYGDEYKDYKNQITAKEIRNNLEIREEIKEEMGNQSEGNIDWIQVNRRARRVEIYHKR